MLASVALEWDRLSGPAWIGMDTATAFFPWYTFLGEQLRSGHIPAWNPYTFTGAPFAADPESGWMYLPAMLAYTWLPVDAALRAHLLFHILLAGLSSYALARVLGANALGGLAAGTLYAHSGFFEGHNVCCYAYADVAAWLPLMLLGAELAIAASTWRTRVLWWGLAGFACSQILAAWIGQGAYYAALVLGSYLACRTLVKREIASLLLNGAGIAAFAVCLGAAGLLPRLEYNVVSNLPGGYPDADVSLRATTLFDWGFRTNWDQLLLQPGFEYIGWPAFLLALLALPLYFVGKAGRVRMLPYFFGLGLVVLILARAEPTPLHALFSFLPGFERIHARSPERALIVFYLAPAMLAAASLTWLSTRRRWTMLAVAVLAVMTLDLRAAWTAQSAVALDGGGDYQFARVDLSAYLAAPANTDFLKSQPGQFRYFGYAGHVFGGPMAYTLRWQDPNIAALQVNNRALLTALDDIQGYNPVHVARYDNLVAALNGQSQNYHHTDIFESGFDSPLLDVLNVRYILMPTTLASDEVAPRYSRRLQPLYADDQVTVLENPSAFPRAWLVHTAVTGDSIAGDDVDLRQVAILETTPPPMAEPTEPSADDVNLVSYATDRLQYRVTTSAAGLLLASETYYSAWHAYVDGQPTPLYPADTALRAVPVPAGEHVVEMRYESAALAVGLFLSGLAVVLLSGVAILLIATLRIRIRIR